MKKSNLRKIIRESIKEILNEQNNPPTVLGPNTLYHVMYPPGFTGPNGNGSIYCVADMDPSIYNGCVGYHQIYLSSNPTQGVHYTDSNYNSVLSMSQWNSLMQQYGPGTSNPPLVYSDFATCQAACTPASLGCTLSDFENAVAPFNVNPQWTIMFHDKFTNHPNGCNFLNSRLQNVQAKLTQLQQAGTNPAWQNKLQDKISAIQAIIAQCCS